MSRPQQQQHTHLLSPCFTQFQNFKRTAGFSLFIFKTPKHDPSTMTSNQTSTRWYFYLQNDPRGSPDDWYRYEASIEATVEAFYQAHRGSQRKKARQLLPVTASSGYQYEVDFQAMTQTNTTSRKSRPIGRTTDGRPPPPNQPQQQEQEPMVPAVAAAAYLPSYQPPAPYQPSDQAPGHQQPAFAFGQAAAAASAFVFGHQPSVAVPVTTPARPGIHAKRRPTADGSGEEIDYKAPEVLHEVHLDESKIFDDVAPPKGKKPAATGKSGDGDDEKKQSDSTSYAHASHDDECVICLDLLWKTDGSENKRVVAIKNCTHRFHYDCIHEALTKLGGKCPLCSKSVEQESGASQTPKGKCPSGTMSYHTTNRSCAGHRNAGTITINYSMPNGIQKSYHDFPGTGYTGAHRTAYLPATAEGYDVLARMQYAFAHGLMFRVGVSLTTSQPNQTTWASIHNKTSMSGGAYGYPDDSYFARVNDEMNGLGVPPTGAACRLWLQKL